MHEDIHWHLPAHIRAELDHEIDMTEARLAGLLPQAPAHDSHEETDTP